MKKERYRINNIPAILYGRESENLYLFVHGKQSYKEEAENLARTVTKSNYQVLGFDFPEHGERKNEEGEFTIRNCVADLHTVMDSLTGKYNSINLYACSIGAYFSLTAFSHVHFNKCLFVSPLLDMERVIQNMMSWANVSEEELKRRGEIETSFGEILSWDYYRYVKEHPVENWNSATHILYGQNDNLTERHVLDSFQERHGCFVTTVPEGEHYFHTPEQLEALNGWIAETAL